MPFPYDKFKGMIGDLYFRNVVVAAPDLIDTLNKAYDQETNEIAKQHLRVMLKSTKIAQKKNIPFCQDMGMQTYFINLGSKMQVDGYKIKEATREGVRECSNGRQWRKTLSNPITRLKDGQQVSNTHPHIYWDWMEDKDYMEVMEVEAV